MKHLKLAFSGLFFLFLTAINAQDHNTLLWQISGNGLSAPSYLFGTIHTMCPDELELSPKVKNALEASEQLVLELDMDEPTFMQDMQRLAMNDNMQNISSELSEEDLQTLNTFLKKHYGADMSQLGILKPFALLSMVFIKGLECPQPASYEEALMQYATTQEWTIEGLETIQDQIAVFEQATTKEQLGWLVKYAADEARLKQDIAKTVAAYKSESLDQLLNLMSDYPEYEVIEEALLYERNEKWIAPIMEQAADQPTFFAVGAAHLPSERGVIKLLEQKGYTLTPISK